MMRMCRQVDLLDFKALTHSLTLNSLAKPRHSHGPVDPSAQRRASESPQDAASAGDCEKLAVEADQQLWLVPSLRSSSSADDRPPPLVVVVVVLASAATADESEEDVVVDDDDDKEEEEESAPTQVAA